MKTPIDKYELYLSSVQDPPTDVELYQDLYRQIRKKPARSLREDFCGTFALSCQWVKSDPRNQALALDLDPEPLAYGMKTYRPLLTKNQQSRLKVLRKNVISQTAPQDLIVAGNFSFWIFKERETVLKYFKQCRRSLKKNQGVLVLDMAGGSEMVLAGSDRKAVVSPTQGKFTYEWQTQSFDPLTQQVKYAIHFKMRDGRKVRNAFTYDWRLWTVPEVRDLLREAGFSDSVAFWDESRSDRYEKYVIADRGKNEDCWITYVAGIA